MERQLLYRARRGDARAFGEIVRLHQARLRAFAARYVPNSDDVYDLVQDAFLNAYRNLPRFDPSREFGPWIRTICLNLIRNHYRASRSRRGVQEAILARLDARSAEDADAFARVEAMRECIDGLQPVHRDFIRQRYGAGFEVQEIARRLNRSATSVSMMLMRIREALSKCVKVRLNA